MVTDTITGSNCLFYHLCQEHFYSLATYLLKISENIYRTILKYSEYLKLLKVVTKMYKNINETIHYNGYTFTFEKINVILVLEVLFAAVDRLPKR